MAEYDTLHRTHVGAQGAAIDAGLRAYMNKVYGLMSVAMLITGAVAWVVASMAMTTNPDMAAAQIGASKYLTSFGVLLYTSPLKWVIMFAPLLVVFGFGAAINRLSEQGAQGVFWFYSALMGASLSSIFVVYTGVSIAQTFLVTAIAFASLSLYGYTTKRNLSGMGSFLMMGLVGLIVASIVNIFMASSALQFAISVIGLLIFAGLTAYDTQKLKITYLQLAQSDSEFLGKSAILGALSLYLDFLNMFMFLLQFLGNRE